jgi:hypothetical protein
MPSVDILCQFAIWKLRESKCWLQVLSEVYGVPLKPVHLDVEPYFEHPRPASPGEGQLPQARSPALLPQPYTVKAVTPAQPSQAQLLPELVRELARPKLQETATQTSNSRGIQAGEQAGPADQKMPSAVSNLPPQTERAPRSIADRPSTGVRPPEAPAEQHLDRYYLAAAGRELDMLAQLMGGAGSSSTPVQGPGLLPGSMRSPSSNKSPARQRERPKSGQVESHSRKWGAPPQKAVAEEQRQSTAASTSNAESQPLQPAHILVPTAAVSSVQEQPSSSADAAGVQQMLPWAQGAWMEQLAAVAAAAASAATAAVQAQRQQFDRPLPSGHWRPMLSEAPSKQEVPVQLGDASDSSMHPTETRPAMPASAPVDIVPIANNDGPSGAQPDKIRQPMSVRTAGVERNVQTEVHKDVQTTASQLAAAAAHVQLEIPLDRPLQFHRPIKDRLVHSSGEASRREVAPGPSMTADFKQTMGSFSAAQAQSYLAPTQLLPVQVNISAFFSPVLQNWQNLFSESILAMADDC